jgi:hypothetical protein
MFLFSFQYSIVFNLYFFYNSFCFQKTQFKDELNKYIFLK